MMTAKTYRHSRAFTLLEVMIVVALIGLLAVMALPGLMKSRKQSQGKRIVSDARVVDTAIDAWAMENNKTDGDSVDLVAINGYSKSGQIRTTDVLGNAYGIGPVGTNQVRISINTKSALGGVSIDWGAY
jgi:prepilin-type N-terminal cleavage/methylation domain-containing protein